MKKFTVVLFMSAFFINTFIYSIDVADIIMITLKNTIKQLEQEITNMEKQASGVSRLLQDRQKIEKQIQEVKKKNNVITLQDKLKTLEAQLDGFAKEFYRLAKDPNGRNLYNEITNVVNQMRNDPTVQRKIQQILTLQQEVNDTVQKQVQTIRSYGKKINQLTKKEQIKLNQLRTQISQTKEQINALLLSEKVDSALEPLEDKLLQNQFEINKAMRRLTSAARADIEQAKNRLEQYEMRLKILRNPEMIERQTAQKILGID